MCVCVCVCVCSMYVRTPVCSVYVHKCAGEVATSEMLHTMSTVIVLPLLLLLLQGKDDQPVEKAVSGKYILGGVEGGTSVMDKDVASITARIDCMRYCQRSSTCAM